MEVKSAPAVSDVPQYEEQGKCDPKEKCVDGEEGAVVWFLVVSHVDDVSVPQRGEGQQLSLA